MRCGRGGKGGKARIPSPQQKESASVDKRRAWQYGQHRFQLAGVIGGGGRRRNSIHHSTTGRCGKCNELLECGIEGGSEEVGERDERVDNGAVRVTI
jgi:hypothetical protein